MESYPIKIVDNIGSYDEGDDSFFNLTPYTHISPLEKIVLYLCEGNREIIGIELHYLGYSTGVFQGIGYKVNHNNKIIINITDDYIERIHGSFVSNKIASIVFVFKSGKEEGFTNKDYIEALLTHFSFKNGLLLGFKVAFNKSLTFLSPIFAEEDKYILSDTTKMIATKTKLGKTFSDSVSFSLPEDIINEGRLIQIDLYHDGNLQIGIQSTYKMNNDYIKTALIGKKSSLCSSIALNEKENESIQSLAIRSGDMIDGIMLTSSKGNSIISGGIGGGPHHFSTTEIASKYIKNESNSNSNVQFIGFEGTSNQVVHSLSLLFKTI